MSPSLFCGRLARESERATKERERELTQKRLLLLLIGSVLYQISLSLSLFVLALSFGHRLARNAL